MLLPGGPMIADFVSLPLIGVKTGADVGAGFAVAHFQRTRKRSSVRGKSNFG